MGDNVKTVMSPISQISEWIRKMMPSEQFPWLVGGLPYTHINSYQDQKCAFYLHGKTHTRLTAFFSSRPAPEGQTIQDFTEAEFMGWLWHQLDHISITDNHDQIDNNASTSSLSF